MAKTPTRLKGIKLGELSLVKRGACQDAKVVIFKSADGDPMVEAIVKACCDEQGAQTFATLLTEEEARRRYWQAHEALYPVMDAFSSSIRSMIADQSLSADTRQSMIRASTEDFLITIREKAPEVETELAKLIAKEADMPTIEELQKQLDTITANLKKAEESLQKAEAEKAELVLKASMTDDEKEHLAKLSDEDKKKFTALAPAERAKAVKKSAEADEVLKTFGGVEIRKSVVGEAPFNIFKSQEEELRKNREDLQKANDEREMVTLTKKADDELSHLPGTSVEKAAVLREVAKMPEAVRKTAESIFAAADKGIAAAFDTKGASTAKAAPDSDQGKFDALVEKTVADDKVSKEEATAIVMKSAEGNELYQQIYKAQRAAA